MSNLFAAIGRVQLSRFEPEFKPKRLEMASRYKEMLRGVPSLRTLELDYGRIVPFNFHVYISDNKRDSVVEALKDDGIEYGIQYKPNHLLTKYFDPSIKLPVTEELYKEVLAIPFHPELRAEDQERVVGVIKKVLCAQH